MAVKAQERRAQGILHSMSSCVYTGVARSVDHVLCDVELLLCVNMFLPGQSGSLDSAVGLQQVVLQDTGAQETHRHDCQGSRGAALCYLHNG